MRTGLMPPLSARVAVAELHPRLALRARFGRLPSLSWGATCFALDVTMLAVAAAATRVGARVPGAHSLPPALLLGFAALCVILLRSRGLYGGRLQLEILDDAKSVVGATTVAAMAVLSAAVVLGIGTATEAAAGAARVWIFASVYLVAGRTALYWSQTQARRRGEIVSPTLIVGAGPVAERAARRLLEHRDLGLLPVGYLDTGGASAAARDVDFPIPVAGSLEDLERVVSDFDVTQVVVNCAGGLVDEDVMPLIDRCGDLGVSVAYVPGAHERITRRLRVEHVGGLPLITSERSDPRGWQFALKYAGDRLAAAALVVLALPVLAGSAAAVWISMGRPLLFRQRRIGRDGAEFDILKFRSMRKPSSPQAASFALRDGSAPGGVEGEDRRTRVGTFLRRSSLDELPQLLNVLNGDMSLVGPRPERPEFVDRFSSDVHRYGERHRVKSGITGWAQVHGLRGQTSIEDRAEWDNWYIENWSLWLDLKILVLTALAVVRFFRKGE